MKAVAKNIGGGAMIASPNVAESQSGPSLLGTWRLVSYEARDPEGRVQYPLGENVSGLLVYDGGGNMSAHVMRNDRPFFAAKDPARGTDAELRAGILKGCARKKAKKSPHLKKKYHFSCIARI